jgi:hypothetical protein
MVAVPTTSADLNTALALLSVVAMTLWLVVLPVEFVFRVTV